MNWLERVLAEHAHLNLDHPDGRAQMSEAILGALPKEPLREALIKSNRAVLANRGIPDGRDDYARELARNGCQGILLELEIAE